MPVSLTYQGLDVLAERRSDSMWGLSTGEEYGQKLSEFFLSHTYLSYTVN